MISPDIFSCADAFDLIARHFSTKLKICIPISSRTIPARGKVVVKGDDMTVSRRMWMKMTKDSGLSSMTCLVLVVLSLICCGQNNNHNMQSPDEPIKSDISGVNQAANNRPQVQNSQMVPDEVLVKFIADTRTETIEHIQAELRLETVRKFRSANLFLMKITDGTDPEAIIRKLKTYPAVEYAEPNYVVKANP